MKKHYRNAELNIHNVIELDITDLNSLCQGVGRYNGMTVFVPNTLPNERVLAQITQIEKRYCVAELLETLVESEYRIKPECCMFYNCGGCDLQHLQYERQLEFKQAQVENCLRRIGGVDTERISVLPIIGMEHPMRYRNKSAFAIGRVDGKVAVGMFKSQTHDVIEPENCLIQSETAVKIMKLVSQWANEFNIKPYDYKTRTGILRHTVIRVSSTDQVLAAIITTENDLPQKAKLIGMLINNIPGLTGIVHSVNTQPSQAILGRNFNTIWGANTITEELMGLKFRVAVPTFLQINHLQTQRLYGTIMAFLKLDGTEEVADIYCGMGAITLPVAKRVRHVIGIESVEASIEDARHNAVLNNIRNADFIAGKAELVLPKLIKHEGFHPDVIIVDPPRSGCGEAVLNAIINSGAGKVIYVSCNPATLARDIKILTAGGFRIEAVQPVDMFPQTSSIETVALLSL